MVPGERAMTSGEEPYLSRNAFLIISTRSRA